MTVPRPKYSGHGFQGRPQGTNDRSPAGFQPPAQVVPRAGPLAACSQVLCTSYPIYGSLTDSTFMSKRINILLPEKTLAVDKVAPRGDRSRFVSEAVLHYVETHGKQSLREQLKAGYLANAEDNLKIAAEWFPLEEEQWQKNHAGRKTKRKK